MEFWSQFEGQLLDGQFKLDKYAGQDGTCAVFLSALSGQDQFVAVKILRAASIEAEKLHWSWKSAKDLQHPNLIRVYATGAADLDGLRIVYGATEYPDATLASAIRERGLIEEEAREILLNCAGALQYLHQKGFVHRYIRPSGIVAVDSNTKVSSDYLSRSTEHGKGLAKLDRYDAPEVEKAGYSPASDVWSLGVTIFEALTQRMPAGYTDPDLKSLPGPFPEIVRQCLHPKPGSRYTAGQILSVLQRGSSGAAAIAAKPEEQSVSKPSSPETSLPRVKPRPESPQPSAAKTSFASDQKLQVKQASAVRNSLPMRYGFSAVVILVCIGWLARTSVQTDRPAAATSQPATPIVVDRLSPPVVDRPSPLGPAKKIKPQAASSATHVVIPPTGSADRARPIWRVVVYTYSNAQNALAKVKNLNATSPELNAQVLSLAGGPSHMVVVGGKMGREEASNLRMRLLADGFPKDSYIQNFPQ